MSTTYYPLKKVDFEALKKKLKSKNALKNFGIVYDSSDGKKNAFAMMGEDGGYLWAYKNRYYGTTFERFGMQAGEAEMIKALENLTSIKIVDEFKIDKYEK